MTVTRHVTEVEALFSSGPWIASCACGWESLMVPSKDEAAKAGADHILAPVVVVTGTWANGHPYFGVVCGAGCRVAGQARWWSIAPDHADHAARAHMRSHLGDPPVLCVGCATFKAGAYHALRDGTRCDVCSATLAERNTQHVSVRMEPDPDRASSADRGEAEHDYRWAVER